MVKSSITELVRVRRLLRALSMPSSIVVVTCYVASVYDRGSGMV